MGGEDSSRWPSEKELAPVVAQAKRGDRGAQGQLYAWYADYVLARAHGRLGRGLRRRADTEDLGQSAFRVVLRELPGFEYRGEPAFRHWVARIVRHKANERVGEQLERRPPASGTRRRRREITMDGEPAVPGPGKRTGPAAEAERHEELERLREAMSGLEETSREVLRLRYEAGNSFDEIARRLGLRSADAARMRHARALVELEKRCRGG